MGSSHGWLGHQRKALVVAQQTTVPENFVRSPSWKPLLFRLCAVGLSLLPLLLCELALRAAGIGKPTDANDPFVGFSDIHPLFVLNKQTGRYEIPKSRQTNFNAEGFLAKK